MLPIPQLFPRTGQNHSGFQKSETDHSRTPLEAGTVSVPCLPTPSMVPHYPLGFKDLYPLLPATYSSSMVSLPLPPLPDTLPPGLCSYCFLCLQHSNHLFLPHLGTTYSNVPHFQKGEVSPRAGQEPNQGYTTKPGPKRPQPEPPTPFHLPLS